MIGTTAIITTMLSAVLSFFSDIPKGDTISVNAVYYLPKHNAITASGEKVDHQKNKSKEHRWIAVSRDLLQEGIVEYGDTLEVISEECPALNGKWIVMDKMGPRHKRMIDFLLLPHEPKELEFWNLHEVKIIR